MTQFEGKKWGVSSSNSYCLGVTQKRTFVVKDNVSRFVQHAAKGKDVSYAAWINRWSAAGGFLWQGQGRGRGDVYNGLRISWNILHLSMFLASAFDQLSVNWRIFLMHDATCTTKHPMRDGETIIINSQNGWYNRQYLCGGVKGLHGRRWSPWPRRRWSSMWRACLYQGALHQWHMHLGSHKQ